MRVDGPDGFTLDGKSSMAMISRDPLDLVAQTIGATTSIPTASCCSSARCSRRRRTAHGPGQGFTHDVGDVVTVSTPKLGVLVNRVNTSDRIAPWTFGAGALMESLARRGVLAGAVPALTPRAAASRLAPPLIATRNRNEGELHDRDP